jgi:excinuclease ABC subunit C
MLQETASAQLMSSTLLSQPEKLEARLKEIPPEPGVYFMRDERDHILYIGKSKKLRSRVRSYFREAQDLSPRIALMVRQVVEIEFIVTDTEAEALALEANLIKLHQPHFNVLLKDDKKYPYVVITWSQDYPRIFITRNRRLGKGQDKYYGPYTDSRLLRDTLNLVRRIFPMRQRPQPLHKDRPCLNYDIGRCPGVCQQKITTEEYHKTIEKIAMVFQGRGSELIDTLTKQMEQAAENLEFEIAAALRDRITGLSSLTAGQKVSLPDDTVSRDAVALAASDKTASIQLFQIRAGKLVGRLGFIADVPENHTNLDLGMILQRVLEEHYQYADPVEIPPEILVQHPLPDSDILAAYLSEKRGRKVAIDSPQRQVKAETIEMVARNAEFELARITKQTEREAASLQDLAVILDLPELPRRVECYDISHIQGSDAVGSQVVFIDGLPAKQYYRHYKIKNPDIHIGRSDDFASHAEVIGRRFRKYNGGVNLEDSDFPDVVIIDGGKGQLSAVVKVLSEMDLMEHVCVVSLAKQHEEIFLPGESTALPTEPEQPGVQLVRRLRDESHRFALNFHRQQRSKRMTRSYLDEIPGLGAHKQKQLMSHFHSIDYIRAADLDALQKVPGVGENLAKSIYNYFH